MIIFVFGEDPLFPKRKVLAMKTRFEEKYDPSKLNSVHFSADGSEIALSEVISAVQTPPFLGEKRFVVVEGLLDGLLKKESLEWAEALSVPESTILIFLDVLSPEKARKHPLYVALKSAGKELHEYGFDASDMGELSTFVREEASLRGVEIDSQAVQTLIAYCGSSPSRLSQELAKLLAYVGKGRIDRTLVEAHVQPILEEQMFVFIDAVADGARARILPLLFDQRSAGLEDAHLLAMLVRQSRILLRARNALDLGVSGDAAMARELGLSPFQVRKAVAQAKRFNSLKLAKIHALAFDLESRTKRGKMNFETAVERLLLAWTANP